MGTPSTMATAVAAGVADLSAAAGAAGCCPLPHAAIRRVIAATADTRIHCELENCVICILCTRKRAVMADMAHAPGGGSLAVTARSLQLSMRFNEKSARSCRRGRGVDRQRMDVRFQEVVDSGVHQAVTCDWGYTAERLGNDAYSEMAVAFGCARMAGVQMTLVLDDENRGRKTALEALA